FGLTQDGSCGCDGSVCGEQPGGFDAELIAPSVLNSTPAVAVVSFDAMVLLMMLTLSASCSDTPPPSHPATLLAMMLFVTVTSYTCARPGSWLRPWPTFGNAPPPLALICCRRRPPPLPSSASLPTIRLASMTVPKPVPSVRPGGQS